MTRNQYIMGLTEAIKMKIKQLALFVLLILIHASSTAQVLPHLRNVQVKSSVKQDTTASMYLYNYTIFNSIQSEGDIFVLRIDVSLRSTVSEIDTTGLVFENNFMENSYRRIYPALEGRIVPVGFPKAPARWDGGVSHSLRASFSGFPKIAPGDSLSGFQMMSRGLPSIRKFIAEPTLDLSEHFNSLDDPEDPASPSEIDSVRNSLNDTSFTIGPSLPPDPFIHLEFLDKFRNYIPQAQGMDWLGNPSFVTQLENQLGQVRSKLVAGDSVQAAGSLANFIELVQATNHGQGPAGASLTSEGYGLLYFNARYLLDRLPEPQEAEPSLIPDLPAALAIASAQASGAFNGDNFTISGQNHTAEGSPAGSGSNVNGILTTTTAGKQGILNGLQAFQQDNITGSGAAPDVVTGSLAFDAQALIDSVLNKVDQTIPAGASGTYGSMAEPVVVHAPQGIQSSGTISGYGILLVDGPLQVSGTMAWTGLVIQRGMSTVGPATSVSTSLTITGGMLVVNEGPFGASLQVSNELIIRASAEALQILRDNLEF